MTKALPVVLLLLTVSCATVPVHQPEQPIEIQWLGHAAFRVASSGGTTFLIDPFLTENPSTPAELKDLSRHRANVILVTHSHGDHLGDAIALSKQNQAPIVAVNMPALYQRENLPESLVQTVNVGGTVTLGHTNVHIVPAMHGSEPSGRPVGFVIEFADGGKAYGQSPEVGLMAVNRFFHPRVIIPMHYASMPTMSTEAEVRAAIGHDPRVRFLKPGETARF